MRPVKAALLAASVIACLTLVSSLAAEPTVSASEVELPERLVVFELFNRAQSGG